jgi:dipeptidyl aminopeptidase/acylaminoacyl peptidase
MARNIILLITAVVLFAALGHAEASKSLNPFTVKDSIEIAYITNPVTWTVNRDPGLVPIISPDNKRVLVVTERGNLSSDCMESTIWMFDRKSVLNFADGISRVKPLPRVIARMRAKSNMAVISDVRWLGDSERIAFLGRRSERPQLFIADVNHSRLQAVTSPEEYVSAFDIAGDTMVYTTLAPAVEHKISDQELVDITGQTIFSLVWPDKNADDLSESHLVRVPNMLHMKREGRDIPISASIDGYPLKLFFPVLFLSPDGKSLITVAPVHKIPSDWQVYEPWYGRSDLALTPENKSAVADDNPWRASQYVLIDLQTGRVTRLVDAPAGRSLFFIAAPTKAIWSKNSRRILVSNTFLPIGPNVGQSERVQRSAAPSVAIIDLDSKQIEPIIYLDQPPRDTRSSKRVTDVLWSDREDRVELTYASSPGNVALPDSDSYELHSGKWTKVENPKATSLPAGNKAGLLIYQDLNQAPVLAADQPGKKNPVIIWDPNPQLSSIGLGRATIYHWHDANGNEWAGILALPPDYQPGHRYPLVLQTHGYEPLKFFADGRYTTGSGGRALCAKGIVVLQMDQPTTFFNTPQEGPFQTEGFESAIRQLTADGLVDPRRVGVIGFSFTCFHVLYALIHRPSLFTAASITDGNNVSYLQYLFATDIPFAQEYDEKMNGGIPFGSAGVNQWAKTAPGFNTDQIETPLLVNSLEKDALVGQWEIYAGLRRLHKPVEMLWLRPPNAPHVLVQPRQRYLSQQTAVDWFDFWLNGMEDPDHSKIGQYERWRELKQMHGVPR